MLGTSADLGGATVDRSVRLATLVAVLLAIAACAALALPAQVFADTLPASGTAAASLPPIFTVLPGVPLAAGRSGPMAVGDFNGDGRSDLAIALGSKVVVRFGTKGGSLGTEHVIGLPGWSEAYVHAIVAAKLDRGGRPDLVVLASLLVKGRFHVEVAVLLNTGHGGFRLAHRYDLGSFALGGFPSALAVRDLNGDHRPDILAAAGTKLVVLLGDGHGAFGRERISNADGQDKDGNLGPLTTLALADINGDGRIDVVAGGYVSQNNPDGLLCVALGRGNGTFRSVSTTDSGELLPDRVVLADLAHDGTQDLIAQYEADGVDYGGPDYTVLTVSRSNGHGGFAKLADYDLLPQADNPPLAAADFNRDGNLDLAIGAPGGLEVMLGDGDGSFQAPLTFSGPFSAPQAFVSGDFNGDGKPDVLVQSGAATGVMFLNGGTAG